VRTLLQGFPSVVLLLVATILEVSGDAVVRTALYDHVGPARAVLFIAGAGLLLGYGTFLNLAPFEFGKVVGLYLATLFIVWQVINFLAFRALPTMPIVGGGVLAVAGSAIITFFEAQLEPPDRPVLAALPSSFALPIMSALHSRQS
jgi:hypothetical protein